jgi:hypothetical protein
VLVKGDENYVELKMIEPHPSFIQPADSSVSVWRYTNLSKFIWMLQKKGLFFCRSDLLGDPYEGYYPKPISDSEDRFVQENREAGTLAGHPEQEARLRSMFHQLLGMPKTLRQQYYLSCWHMNEAESLAMWKLYTAHNESICIRSTYVTLAELLPAPCFLGVVRYIDYRTDYIDQLNLLNYIVHKRKSFEHEREARAVIYRREGPTIQFADIGGKGLLVPIDLNKLVREIYVSPDSDAMLMEIVETLARTSGVDAPVRQSEVNAPPSY